MRIKWWHVAFAVGALGLWGGIGYAVYWAVTNPTLREVGRMMDDRVTTAAKPSYKTLDATYRVTECGRDGSVPAYTVRVQFAAPDRGRVERTGKWPFTAVQTKHGVRLYFPEEKLLLLMPLGEEVEVYPVEGAALCRTDRPPGTGSESVAGWLMYPLTEDQWRFGPPRRLAGRECTAVEYRPKKGEEYDPWTIWIDRPRRLPMAEQRAGRSSYEATAVHVDRALPPQTFELPVPPGTQVVKGRISQLCDVQEIADALDGGPIDFALSALVDQTGPVEVVSPTYLPPNYWYAMQRGAQYDDDDAEGWELTVLFLGAAGDTIRFRQEQWEWSEDDEEEPAGQVISMKVRGKPARLFTLKTPPYPWRVLRWTEYGIDCELEASEASAAELQKMAESMRLETLEPEPEED